PTSIVRAAWQNLRAGRVVAGGSTITQQLARALVPRPRTFLGKVQEAAWALRLEAHLTKREIFTQYVNRVPLGNNTVGVAAASEVYFGTLPQHVSLGQAALLASIPRGPTAYNPLRAGPRVEARRQWVLGRLEATALASSTDVAAARTSALDVSHVATSFRAPHFVDAVLSQRAALGLSDATTIHTSLDGQLQADVEALVAREVSHLVERRVSNAAVVVIDNATDEVLAYVGSADFFSAVSEGQNDGVQMRRQPGSALKPFIYAEAFRRGEYTPATVIADVETAFGSSKGAYAPKNYDRRVHGPVRARQALANSYNVPAVKVAEDVGVLTALTVLRRAGFESLRKDAEHYGLGLVLGNGEVSLWEAARAYAGLSRGGWVRPLRPVLEASSANGVAVTPVESFHARRFGDARAVALVTHILADNSARAAAFGLDNALRLPFPVAAKTGTSKGYSDNWTVGFTRERTVAVWAGNFDGTPMVQVSGITGAGPLFNAVMERAMRGLRPSPLVDMRGLEQVHICPLSGELAGPQCPAAMNEVFLPGTAPTSSCAVHREVDAQLASQLRARCDAVASRDGRITDVGLDFYDWARNEGLTPEPWLARLCAEPTVKDAAVRILHPASGDEFLMVSDLPTVDQAIPLRVRAAPSSGRLGVRLDGRTLAPLEPPYTSRIPVSPGRHLLEVTDVSGTALTQVRYLVRGETSLR
ncbi:MAG: penicillin-binding protein 1C, partial [Archangium sp.]|nr:penicillin-binding protein 1C [Archangium sp.]